MHVVLVSLLTQLHVDACLQETDVDQEEVECIVANLIHQQFIKGYIAHKQQVLVVSKKDPFPSVQKRE